MAFEWMVEEKNLLNIKKMVAVAWRMNGPQLRTYCRKLEENRESVLPGRTGSAFMQELERISDHGTDAEKRVWQLLMQDADRLLYIVHTYRNLDREAWLVSLPKLEARQKQYFKTELGTAFIFGLKEKMGMVIPEDKKQIRLGAVSEKIGIRAVSVDDDMDDVEELEQLAIWLMRDEKEENKNRKKKKIFAIRQIKRAAVPTLACLSACFMVLWLYGRFVNVQDRWDLQQMKASALKETEVSVQENMERAAGAVNYEQKLADTDPLSKREMVGEEQSESVPQKLSQYREMSEKYPQLFGWLQIPGTQIDMPVMRCSEGDRNFYLHHDFSGKESAEGALFVDVENSICPLDDNTVIYGHNMKNGHIFGTLDRYEDMDFFQEHRVVYFDTIYETGVYEAVAVLKTRILNEDEQGFRYYQFFQYDSEEEFQECRDFVESNRLFGTEDELQYGDRILMLSTCEYSQENGRLVVVARKLL